MKFSEEKKNELEELYQKLLHDEKVLKMKEIPMHRGSNTYLHSFRVAKLAVKRGIKHKHPDLDTLLLASIFHDYYLYDWRKNYSLKKRHVRRHPFIAAENAKKDFDINDKVVEAIQTHMWPFNFKRFPLTKEARILSFADDSIATREVLTSKKHKQKRMNQYYKNIERLFDK